MSLLVLCSGCYVLPGSVLRVRGGGGVVVGALRVVRVWVFQVGHLQLLYHRPHVYKMLALSFGHVYSKHVVAIF